MSPTSYQAAPPRVAVECGEIIGNHRNECQGAVWNRPQVRGPGSEGGTAGEDGKGSRSRLGGELGALVLSKDEGDLAGTGVAELLSGNSLDGERVGP